MNEYREMLQAAEWSDRFFNGDWTPQIDPFVMTDEDQRFVISEAAREFLHLFPDCPYHEDWLVRDFLRRL